MKRTIKSSLKAIIPQKQQGKLKHLFNKVRYFGWKYKCPFCKSHVNSLLPSGFGFPVLIEKNVVGGGNRPNAECPICFSLDRERLLYLYLQKKTNIFTEPLRLLHVAPESQLTAIIEKHANIDYLTADLNPANVMVKMDITDINYPNNSFDAIICNHVLEHIVDDKKAMRELCRVLKPGGWGILQVPMSLSLDKTFEDASVTTPSEKEAVFGQSDHVRIYAIDYLDRLKESGFQVVQFKWWQDQQFAESNKNNKYGLLPNESVFHVTKA